MKKTFILIAALFLSIPNFIHAQIEVDGNLRYGNEWIDFDKEYYKISIKEDGLYRISSADLSQVGFPISTVSGNELQLFHYGELVPIRVSTEGFLGSSDFIEFIGEQNDGRLDEHMYEKIEYHFNPEYSMYNDESAYFLSWTDDSDETLFLEEVVTDLNQSLPPIERFYMAETMQVFSDEVLKPAAAGSVRYSSMRLAEGFGSGLAPETEFSFAIDEVYDIGPNPSIEMRISGNANDHFADLTINDRFIKRNSFDSNLVSIFSEEIDLNLLQTDNKVKLQGRHNGADYLTIAYAKLVYPRQFVFNGASFSHIKMDQSVFTRYLELLEYDLDGGEVIVYDNNNNQYFPTVIENNIAKVLIPGAANDRDLKIYNSQNGGVSAPSIRKMNFVDYSEFNPDYMIITSQKFNNPAEPYLQDYVDYRSSELGGSFNPHIVYVEELYNQFAYGIDRHPLSIKNFINNIVDVWDNLQYTFIIGKGFEYPNYRTEEDFQKSENQFYTVPTFGFPGSDNLLLSKNLSTIPRTPTGRLPIREIEDLRLYLEKVKQHEDPLALAQTIEDQQWKKKILHLSGGDLESLQNNIFNFLTEMEGEIESNNYGGDVTTFRKTSSEPIQASDSKELFGLINDGLSIITFFGHSTAGTFDFSLEQPSKYENEGKYPLIISLGCFSGNIHTSTVGISEDFVIEDNKGAIAFIAASGTGNARPQFDSGFEFYSNIGNDQYGNSIGVSLHETLTIRDTIDPRQAFVRTLNEQLTLNGDPAIRLISNETADLTFDFESVKTEPSIVSTNLDSFELSFDLVNLGRATTGDANLNIKRLNPRGELIYENNVRVDIPGFSRNVTVKIPTDGASFIGKNQLLLHIDDINEIEERPDPEAENNNVLVSATGAEGFEFFVLDIGTTPVYPQEFSIIGTSDITLKASTNNLFVDEQKYIIQIDTTETFDSPFLQGYETTQGGGLVEWKPDINYQNEEVYYWRISPDSTTAEIGYLWNNSSFVFIEDAPRGWNQSHYYQYLTDEYDGLVMPPSRQLQYDTSGFWVSIHNQIYQGNESITGYQFNFETFAASIRPWEFMDGGVGVIVGDKTTGAGFRNFGGSFGSINGGTNSDNVFAYDTKDAASRESLVSFLENEIGEGDYVIFFTVISNEDSEIGAMDWDSANGKSLIQVLEEQGATKLDQLKERGSVPYTFIYQKDVAAYEEDLADQKSDFIRTDYFLPRAGVDGSMSSDIIGPASAWDKFVFQESDKGGNDNTYFVVYGIDENGNETILFPEVRENNLDLSRVETSQYPYLRLAYFSEDQSQRTAPNLDYWRIFFSRLPDAAVNPNAHFVFKGKNVQRGKDMSFEVAIDNVSDVDMDSLLVKYTVVGQDNVSLVDYERLAPIASGERVIANYSRNTSTFSGFYQFTMEVNPDEDQLEEFHFNNFDIVEFEVGADNKNPLMDVTFDGSHIMDFDIVSPQPLINIVVRDENEFLPINDISAFEIALQNLTTGEFESLVSDDPRLNFIPAQEGSENKAYLEFTPDLEEGDYKLIAQASDASGNFAGDNAYEVTFRVIKSQSISNMLNYPNPFSTSTQFVFTLTGELPQEIKIQVMTLSGKVVKEITGAELGSIRVGNNITDYKWDGTDDYGQRLANGVYLYRMISKNSDGVEIDKFEIQSTNQFFNKDFGKLVIMR